MKTIFQVLQEHGVDWKVFYSDIPFWFVFAGPWRRTRRSPPASAR